MPPNNRDKKRGVGRDETDPRFQLVPEGKSWFFGIGINKYQEFTNLNNAIKDVKDIHNILMEEYDVDPACSFLLLDENATREGIIDHLDTLINKVGKDDKLIIYYSGHGHLDQNQNGFWIPNDAEQNRTANYIRNSTIRDFVTDIKARHILLISDSCFSGALFLRGMSRSATAIDQLEQRVSRWAISSGRHDEEVYDGKPGENSPFTQSILDVLRENKLAKLNVSKVADRVIELTRAEYAQLPEGNPLFQVGHKGGQYVFRRKEGNEMEISAHNGAMPRPLFSSPNIITARSVEVKGGSFMMGNEDLDAPEHDKPVHEVKMADFLIDSYPVSVGQFRQFVEMTDYVTDAEKLGEVTILGVVEKGVNWRHDVNGSLRSQEEDEHPVIFVSWNDAMNYANYMKKRLPTEAEWEYAARGGVHKDPSVYSGGEEAERVAWFLDNAKESTHPIGEKLSNRLGIYDMSGLVWEWCGDYFSPLYYAQCEKDNPRGPDSGSHRVLRGGSWSNPARKIEVTHRFSGPPELMSNSIGFRCVEEIK